MLATQASEWGSTGSAETLRRQALSAGKSGQPAIVAPPPLAALGLGLALGLGEFRFVGAAVGGAGVAVAGGLRVGATIAGSVAAGPTGVTVAVVELATGGSV